MPNGRVLTIPWLPLRSLLSEAWLAYLGTSQYAEVPAARPSPGLVAEAALDRLFLLTINALAGLPPSSTVRRTRNELREARELFEQNGWLKDPRSYHLDPPPVADFELTDAQGWQGRHRVGYQHLQFESGYRPHPHEPGRERWLEFEQNLNAHAYVLEHQGSDRPWLVCVHGFAMGSPVANFRGFDVKWLHQKLGLNLLMPVLPLHGPRGSGQLSGRDLLSSDFVSMLHSFAHAVWDIRRSLSWVRQRGGRRVGLYGISLGGYNSALVAAMEADLRCVIAGIPAVDLPSSARANMPWIMRTSEKEFEIDWEAFRAAAHVVSPLALRPLVPREGRFIYAGISDRMARPDQARGLWRHWDRPQIHWFQGGHIGYMWKAGVRRFVTDALRSSGML